MVEKHNAYLKSLTTPLSVPSDLGLQFADTECESSESDLGDLVVRNDGDLWDAKQSGKKSESRLEPVLCLPKRILRSCNSIIQSLPSHFQIDTQADHRSDLYNIDRPERRWFCLPRFAAHTFRLDRPCCKHVQLQFIVFLGHEIYIEKVEAGGFGISVAKKRNPFFVDSRIDPSKLDINMINFSINIQNDTDSKTEYLNDTIWYDTTWKGKEMKWH